MPEPPLTPAAPSPAGPSPRLPSLSLLAQRPLLAAWLACLLAFVLLTILLMATPTLEIDKSLAFETYDWRNYLGPLPRLEGRAGDALAFSVLTLVFAAWLALRRFLTEALVVLAAFLPAVVVVFMKELTHELPPQRFGGIAQTGSAFPSGHVVGLVLLSVLAWAFADRLLVWPPLVWLGRAGCALVLLTAGYTRIWTGTHWPSDVLGAYLLSALFLIPALAFVARRSPRPA